MKERDDLDNEISEEFTNTETPSTSEFTSVVPSTSEVPHVFVERNSNLDLEKRHFAHMQSWSLSVIATGTVLTLMYFAKPVLIVMMFSVLIAFSLAPIVDGFERAIRMPKSLGALIAVAVFVAVVYGITWASYNQVEGFLEQLPKYSHNMREEVMRFQHKAEQLKRTTESVLPANEDEKNAIKVQQTSSWVDSTFQGAASATEIVLLISFIPFIVYFMLSWQEHVRSATVMLFNMENRNTAYVTLGLISQMIRGFIIGNLVVGLFMSVASTIIFGLLGIPYFYFIGLISGFLTLIPYLGVALAIVPPLAAGIGQIHAGDLVVIAFAVFALHLFGMNVLYPKIIGKRMQLNPLAVTIALLFWGWLWGAMGLILAVPITGAMKIVFDHIEGLRPYGTWLGE